MEGFYVPSSRSKAYVSDITDVGIQKQAALQELGKTYESTIDNAYASYLANQRSIQASAMGQGYKEAYMQAQEQNLLSQTAEANISAATARAQLESNEAAAKQELASQFETDISNYNRLAKSMEDYLSYVKTLEGAHTYFDMSEQEFKDISAESVYDKLFTAQLQAFKTDEEERGMSYNEWMSSQLKDTAADSAWSKWLYSGGWQEFLKAYERSKSSESRIQSEIDAKIASEKAIELAKQEAENKKKSNTYRPSGKAFLI